jgi:phage baseplate assembly protein W
MALPKGFDVPFRLFQAGNSPNVVEGNDALDRSIRTIIRTFPGERVYRPTFGSFARGNVFDTMTEITAVQIGASLRRAITNWEPRVRVKNVLFELEDSTVYLTVVWRPAGQSDDSTTTVEFGG